MPGVCPRCLREVYFAEEKLALGKVWHTFCFSCRNCRKLLDSCTVATHGGELFCRNCYARHFTPSVQPPATRLDFPTDRRGSHNSASVDEVSGSACDSFSDCYCCCCCGEECSLAKIHSELREIRSQKQRLRGGGEDEDVEEFHFADGNRRCSETDCSNLGVVSSISTLCNAPPSPTAVTAWYNRQHFASQSTFGGPTCVKTRLGRPSSTPSRVNALTTPRNNHSCSNNISNYITAGHKCSVVRRFLSPCRAVNQLQNRQRYQNRQRQIERPETQLTELQEQQLSKNHKQLQHRVQPQKQQESETSPEPEARSQLQDTDQDQQDLQNQDQEEQQPLQKSDQQLEESQPQPESRQSDEKSDNEEQHEEQQPRSQLPESQHQLLYQQKQQPQQLDQQNKQLPKQYRPSYLISQHHRLHHQQLQQRIKNFGCKRGAHVIRSHSPQRFIEPRTKSPQRGGGGGGGCCSSSPLQDDSGYGACGPKVPSGCECLGGGLDCQRCGRKVYQAEMQIASGVPYHNICFSCFCCRKPLEPLTYQENCGEIYCKQCYVRNFGPQGYGYGAGAGALQTPL